MRETKIIIAAVIFLALSCFKFLVPQAVSTMRSEIARQIDRNMDYEAVVVSLAKKVEDYSRYFEQKTEMLQPISVQTPPASTAPQQTAPEKTETPVLSPSPEPMDTATDLICDYVPPLEAVTVSSGFGSRQHPIDDAEKFHYGVDLRADSGDEIYAFADGVVSAAEYSDSYGNYILISHDDTYSTLYAHCSKLMVQAGDRVQAGDKIALVGQTGLATGPHLHFELRENDVCVDPMELLC